MRRKACPRSLAPPVFKEDLSTKTFTSPKADLETVGNLYEKEFDEKLGRQSCVCISCSGRTRTW